MLLLLGDRFNHPGEKITETVLGRGGGRGGAETVKSEHLNIKLEFKY